MTISRSFAQLVIVCTILFGTSLATRPTPAVAAAEQCFTETGQCIAGRFLDYWQGHGGLAINGYPLTSERREVLEDDKEYTVQYFERVRMELHPENAAPYDVLLGQFGRQIFRETFNIAPYEYAQALAPVQPLPGMTFFPETGHNISPRFLAYWQANGGLAQFGYPLGEEVDEAFYSSAGVQYFRVQYFERARFEYHPENANTPYEVLLGQFGRQFSVWATSIADPFAVLYRTNAQLREQLGPPVLIDNGNGSGPRVVTAKGAFLSFEHGTMIYTGGRIQVLCGTAESGTAVIGPRIVFGEPDSWTPDQPVGGGLGPRPGLYEPKYGFGKIWPAYRDCLGYATSPDETAYTYTAQDFAHLGFLITTPDGTSVYALYKESRGPQQLGGYYQRYTLPK